MKSFNTLGLILEECERTIPGIFWSIVFSLAIFLNFDFNLLSNSTHINRSRIPYTCYEIRCGSQAPISREQNSTIDAKRGGPYAGQAQ